MSKSIKIRNTIFLFLTAIIWGVAFVAQSVSMDYIGPMTFIFLRSIIGGTVLIPVIFFLDGMNKKKENEAGKLIKSKAAFSGWKDPNLIKGGLVCGTWLFLGNCFQQNGIKYTTVGKAGFITAFYIIIIPLLGLLFKKYCGPKIWIAVFIALIGLYLLCINERLQIQKGDFLMLICAFMFSFQVLSIDHYNQLADGVKLSCLQFFVCGFLAFIFMILTEKPDISMIRAAALPILYTGVMSTGVAYTLQTIGQRGLNPTIAALILSMESVFSAVAGFLILHQVLSLRELAGSGLMLLAIILAQLPDKAPIPVSQDG